jgi:peptidoglycan hydrolase-like protein with peptidoglycan-binding domain
MKSKNLILTAAILTGTIALAAQTTSAQIWAAGNPLENRNAEKQFEQGNSPPTSGSQRDISGISKDDINQVKEALREKGFDPGPMNGTVDRQTRAALSDFQRDNDLPVTGSLDQQTGGKLGVTVGRDTGSVEPQSHMGSYSNRHSD